MRQILTNGFQIIEIVRIQTFKFGLHVRSTISDILKRYRINTDEKKNAKNFSLIEISCKTFSIHDIISVWRNNDFKMFSSLSK